MAKKWCTLMQNLGGRDGTAVHCGVVIEEVFTHIHTHTHTHTPDLHPITSFQIRAAYKPGGGSPSVTPPPRPVHGMVSLVRSLDL